MFPVYETVGSAFLCCINTKAKLQKGDLLVLSATYLPSSVFVREIHGGKVDESKISQQHVKLQGARVELNTFMDRRFKM